jgi:RNA polymerase sigma factor (sigma-70 family)
LSSVRSAILHHLRHELAEGATDRQLLEDFLGHRDPAALEALVRRHGPMVWGVCRRLLGHHDAEDAFQATFLVLLRKAGTIASRDLLANWLYGVACQTARKARASIARRGTRERQVEELPDREATPPDPWGDLGPVLDRELSCLPEKYRVLIVLCDLQGRTRKEVAEQLGCPEGTVAGRLVRARALLARRVARHGLAGSVIGLPQLAAPVPASVIAATVRLASGGVIPTAVLALTEGVQNAMYLSKLKVAGAVLVLAACGLVACGMMSARGVGVETVPGADMPKEVVAEKAEPLAVTVKPRTNILRVKVPFTVDLRVANTSDAAQTFRVMNCSWYEHWKSSNGRVSWLGWPCTRNFAVTVTLEPGQAYERTLEMLLLDGELLEEVSFRMGFTPIGGKQTYRSNALTLPVEPEGAAKEDREKLQGTWAAVAVERDGKAVPAEEVKRLDLHLIVAGDDFQLRPLAGLGPEHFPHGTYRLYATSRPKALDLVVQRPLSVANQNDTVLGIYELDGDRLQVLRGLPGQARPTEFKTTPKSGLEVIVFQRTKP